MCDDFSLCLCGGRVSVSVDVRRLWKTPHRTWNTTEWDIFLGAARSWLGWLWLLLCCIFCLHLCLLVVVCGRRPHPPYSTVPAVTCGEKHEIERCKLVRLRVDLIRKNLIFAKWIFLQVFHGFVVSSLHIFSGLNAIGHGPYRPDQAVAVLTHFDFVTPRKQTMQ